MYNNESKVINLTYDSLNRLTAKIVNNTDSNINLSYDSQFDGTLSNITGNITKRFTYDERYRIVKEEVNVLGTWFVTQNFYDSADRVVQAVLPTGSELEFYYDTKGMLNQIKGYINGTIYNEFGSALNRSYKSGLITTYAYGNRDGRLRQIKTSSIQQLNYSYDSVGNVMSILDPINLRNHHMKYDFLDRLVNTSINGSSFKYSYNSIGNILKTDRDGNVTYYRYGDLAHAPSQLFTNSTGTDIEVYNLENLGTTRHRIYEFNLAGDANVLWNANFGDGNTELGDVDVDTSVIMFVEHNYTSAGAYFVNITTNYSQYYLDYFEFGIGSRYLKLIDSENTEALMEFLVYSDINDTVYGVSFDCNDSLIVSDEDFNLTNEDAMIFVEYNFNSSGYKHFECTVNSPDGNSTEAVNFVLKPIEILNYDSYSINELTKTISFDIKNNFNDRNISWSIVSDSLLSGNEFVPSGSSVRVSKNITFDSDGFKSLKVNVTVDSYTTEIYDGFLLGGLSIENYYVYGNTTKILYFDVVNSLDSDMNVTVNLTNPVVSMFLNVSPLETVMMVFENNYSGENEVLITATNGTYSDTIYDSFVISTLEVIYLTLIEFTSSAISEIYVLNNFEEMNVSWSLESDEVIRSNGTLLLNESEEALIYVEADYSIGVHNVTAKVNSSEYSGTDEGIIII